MAFQKAVPTSFGGAKGYVKGSARTAVWVSMVLLGLGIYAVASPYLKRVPLLGSGIRAGEGMLPGKGAAMSTDQWGRAA